MTKLFSFLLIFCIVFSAKAELLYDLSPFDPEQAFASDSVPGQFNNQRLAEAFSLSMPAEIARMKWWGRSEGAFFEDLQNMETFTVAVFTDIGGLPGSELVSETVPTESVNPVVVDTNSQGLPIYEFDYTLSNPITVSPGSYWFSVGTKNFDPDGDGFYWNAAIPEESGNFAAQIPVGGKWQISGFTDLSFQIHGTIVPEPASIFALGIFLLLLRRR